MKKIFTLTAAFLMLASFTSKAQSFTVTAYGEPVKNGDVIEVKGEVELEPELGYTGCVWDPELIVKSDANIKGTVKVTTTVTSWKFCGFGGQCITVLPNTAGGTKEGIFSSTGVSLQIDCEMEAYDDEKLIAPENNIVTVVITGGGQEMTLTLKADVPAELASVGEIGVSDAAPVYYNLQGQKVDNPVKGLFIKVAGGKSSKVMM